MFAPPVAKPKSAPPQRSTGATAQRPSLAASTQGQLFQRTISNQAMLRLQAQRTRVTRNDPRALEIKADNAPTAAQEAVPLWNFAEIPVFSSDHAEPFQLPPLFWAPRLPGPIQPKLEV